MNDYLDPQRAKALTQAANQRSRANGNPADLTAEELIAIFDESEGKCAYCKTYVGIENLVVDHIVPVTRGGASTRTNIAGACVSCNASKHNHLLNEWTPSPIKRLNLNGQRLTAWLPPGYLERITVLMDTLHRQGVDLRNEKHPTVLSISKLLRYLIEQEEQRQNTGGQHGLG